MIKSTSLRIGNIVQDEHGVMQFVNRIWIGGAELDGSDDLDHTDEEMFGVEITPEILLASGCTPTGEGIDTFKIPTTDGSVYYINTLSNQGIHCVSISHPMIDADRTAFVWRIKYLHHFQNLIFDLTGQELKEFSIN